MLQPRVAVKRFITDDAAVKLALGRYAQFMHSLRDEELPVGIDVWVTSGARAPHVRSDQVQGGFELFRGGWYGSIESYYRRFDGVATNNFADDPNTSSDDLLAGDGTSYGVDVLIRRDRGRVRGFLSTSWLRARPRVSATAIQTAVHPRACRTCMTFASRCRTTRSSARTPM